MFLSNYATGEGILLPAGHTAIWLSKFLQLLIKVVALLVWFLIFLIISADSYHVLVNNEVLQPKNKDTIAFVKLR